MASEDKGGVTEEELQARCGHECLMKPDHEGLHFYGHICGPHSYEGVVAERDKLRKHVAYLEHEIDDLANGPWRDEYAIADRLCALLEEDDDDN